MELIVKSIEELPSAARTLAPALLERGGVVALHGDMGAGKTTLISALVREAGSDDAVSSPTFALVNEYATPGRTIYHFDFYRIDSEQEAFDLGYEEYFYSGGLCLVEWPEKIERLLPDNTLHLHIRVLPDSSRKIVITPTQD